jgi:UDP-N-acetylmuramate dehydrogenase
MDNFISELKASFGDNRVKIDELLSLHSPLKVGGPAKLYIELDKSEDLVKLVRAAKEHNVPFVMIGSGTKTLFSDSGFDGLVIKNNTRKFDILSRKGKIRNNKIDVDRAYVYADSGAIVNQVVRFAIEQNLSGLEEILGMPGTIGGMLYDQHMTTVVSPVLYQIQAISHSGTIQQVSDHDLYFADSKGIMRHGNYVVLSVIFELFPGHSALLWEKGEKAIEKRTKQKPESLLSYPAFADITVSEAMSVPTPSYDRSAAYLLQKAGVLGLQVGDAMLSKQAPNYIQNLGNATGNDMIAVLEESAHIVMKKFGVRLAPLFAIYK